MGKTEGSKLSTGSLGSFKGSYTVIPSGSNAALTFYGEDFKIFFTTTTNTKIKVKVDGVYQTEMTWHTGIIDATSDVFDISYTDSPHSYYDLVDVTTAENPSILRLTNILDYEEHTLIIEVNDGSLYLEAIAVFDTSLWNNIRDIDTTLLTNSLSLEQDIEEQRNDVIIVGTENGIFNIDGQIVNPNNPLYIHTYARAVDLSSVYNAHSPDYMGRHMPFEVYNDRILNQSRADHIALNALKKYRNPKISASFQIPGDPRLDPFDPIGFNELKLNILPLGERIWINTISETISEGEYLSSITPIGREPMPSFMTKGEPDIRLFNYEPIINISLKSQGFNITGDDATKSGSIVTIGTSPGWATNIWADYYYYDHNGQEFLIISNTTDTLTVLLLGQTIVEGNWSISFDPFDSDQKGASLEIHYDQVINAKISIWIKDANNNILARVNEDTYQLTQEWGEDKVLYWSGIVKYNTIGNKAGCYVSPYSTSFTSPLEIVFNITPEDYDANPVEIKTNGNSTNGHNGEITINSATVVNSSTGSIRIYPKLLYETPVVRVKAEGSSLHSEDIFYRGYITNTSHPGNYVLTLSGNPGFSTNQYQNYLIGDLATRRSAVILSNTSNTITVDAYHDEYTGTHLVVNNFVMILGQNGGLTEQIIHDTFRSTDNDANGLKLIAEIIDKPTPSVFVGNMVHSSHWTGEDDDFPNLIHFNDGTTQYRENDAKDNGQQYFERGLYHTQMFSYDSDSLSQGYPLMTDNVLQNIDFRISANLTVYKVRKWSTGQYWGELTKLGDTIQNHILTEGFMKPSEFIYYLNPSTLIIKGGDDAEVQNILIHNTEIDTGIYFLYEFSFMDRAGRFTNNAWDTTKSPTDMIGAERPFRYLIGWQPEDSSRVPYLKHWYTGTNEPQEIPNFPGMFRALMVWR